MRQFFKDSNGKDVLYVLKKKIEVNIEKLKISNNESNKTFLRNAINNIESINSNENIDTEILFIKESIYKLKTNLENSLTVNKNFKYNPDFIFHPVFSGIENVSDKTFHDVFGTEIDNIISLQRYDTRNGWRFPFPAKRYNKLTKGKHVLIIDSGSLTGDSLVQLIDSIAFLEVGRIDFLSIIGRIDDFQREFYSRLKSIKVKNYIHDKEEKRDIDTIVNLNLFFGVNIHIPPYGSKISCPFCQEINYLESFIDRFKGKDIPIKTKEYINNRLNNEIRLVENKNENWKPSYIPTIKKSNKDKNTEPEIDFKNIFIMRDKVGKVDSYRFYEEYFEPFNVSIINIDSEIFKDKENLKEYELILICILHEPSIFGVIKDLLSNIFEITNFIIDNIVFGNENSLNTFNYKWTKYAFVRLAVIFKGNELYNTESIDKLLYFSIDDNDGLNYISFLLTEGFLGHSKEEIINKNTPVILNDLYHKTNANKNVLHHLIRSITQFYEKTSIKTVNDAFLNLNNFFVKEGSVNSHSALENLFSSLSRNIVNPKLIEERQQIIYRQLQDIKDIIKDNIYENLVKIKEEEHLKKCYENTYNRFLNSDSIYSEIKNLFKNLDKLNDESNNYKSNLVIVAKQYSDFQFKHLIKGSDDNYSFIEFCTDYYANLKDCIIGALDSGELKKYTEQLNYNPFDNSNLEKFNFSVRMHSKILTNALIEVFKNASKYATKNKNISLSVSFDIKHFEQNRKFIIDQNYPFDNPKKIKRGTEEIIKKSFITFCGGKNYKVIEQPNYKIEITF